MAKKEYVVQTPLMGVTKNGKAVPAGEIVTLEEDDVTMLVEMGVLRVTDAQAITDAKGAAAVDAAAK